MNGVGTAGPMLELDGAFRVACMFSELTCRCRLCSLLLKESGWIKRPDERSHFFL